MKTRLILAMEEALLRAASFVDSTLNKSYLSVKPPENRNIPMTSMKSMGNSPVHQSVPITWQVTSTKNLGEFIHERYNKDESSQRFFAKAGALFTKRLPPDLSSPVSVR